MYIVSIFVTLPCTLKYVCKEVFAATHIELVYIELQRRIIHHFLSQRKIAAKLSPSFKHMDQFTNYCRKFITVRPLAENCRWQANS